jgi:outer membrane protein OmpA-like peptidoglycan-associated protein
MRKNTRICILITLLLSTSQLFAFTQWASQVIGFSSEYTDKGHLYRYRAQQVLGKPNKLPAMGSSPCAWSPAKQNNGFEWIEVAFEQPQYIRQVAVGESFHPGSIVNIIITDKSGISRSVYKAGENKFERTQDGGMFHVFFQPTDFKVQKVKVILDTRLVNGWNHLDAIAISDDSQPVNAVINLVEGIEQHMIEPLPQTVNSAYDEIFPVISPDGKTLYFDRKNHPENTQGKYVNDDIWVTHLNNGEWGIAQKMPQPLNNGNHNYVCSVTPDGNALLLGNVYEANGGASGGVSITYKDSGQWSFPQPLEIKDYQNLNEYSEFSLSNNRKILVMAIETEASYGDRDIYVCFANEQGVWSKPLNLGNQINTAATELTPFLAADNRTLYFSSAGFSGFGNTDMFVSKRLDDSWTNWSVPLNMGPLLNSPDWDISYTVDAAGEFAYFVSYANANNNSADIFRVKLPIQARPDPVVLLSGNVFDALSQKPLKAEILFREQGQNKEAGIALSDSENGAFKLTLKPDITYILWAKAKNYFATTDTIFLTTEQAGTSRKLYLRPLSVGDTISLEQVNFVKGEAFFLEASYPELDRITQMMQQSNSMVILLEGHTDISGNERANMALSESRVLAVKRYLVERGIEKDRIKLKAYGESRPLTYNRDEASRRKNRRVVFRVLAL